jgi:probable HAF family extracellular repeat protein
MVGLYDLPGGKFDSCAYAVSADGSVVVGQGSTASGDEAFLWTETNGIVNLRDMLMNEYALDLTGWTLKNATGISDDGLIIVGYGTNLNGYTEAWVATIPEPATLLIFGLGSLLLKRSIYRKS